MKISTHPGWQMLTLAAMLMVSGAFAEEMVSGMVKMESETIAIGVGVNWGDGTLSYKEAMFLSASPDARRLPGLKGEAF